jgi:hypothetical protein
MADIGTHPVDEFYNWLAPRLDDVFEDRALQIEIGHRLSAVSPGIQWEAGPFDNDQRFFAFSPNNRRKLLELTTELASRAPAVKGWVFLPAKPRKQWHSRRIALRSGDGTDRTFEMDDWIYSLTSFKGGEFFDVNLVPLGTVASPDELEQVAHMLVEFELGERLFLEFVDRVNIISQTDLEHSGNRIAQLHDHLLQELGKHSRH